MDKSKGYFLVWRSLEDWPDWHRKPFTPGQSWIDMLMKTNYEAKSEYRDGHLIKSERGQLVMSQSEMAARWGWSRGRVQDFLRSLETRHQIRQQTSPVTTITTILNYEDGQTYQQPKKRQNSSRAAAEQQQSSTPSIRKPKGNSLNSLNSLNTEENVAPSDSSNHSEPTLPFTTDPPYLLILNDGNLHSFTPEEVDQYQKSYPGVDVKQEFREMRQWCVDNPTKRKTEKGIHAFVNRWLSKEQDKGNGKGRQPPLTFEQQKLKNTLEAGERWLKRRQDERQRGEEILEGTDHLGSDVRKGSQ